MAASQVQNLLHLAQSALSGNTTPKDFKSLVKLSEIILGSSYIAKLSEETISSVLFFDIGALEKDSLYLDNLNFEMNWEVFLSQNMSLAFVPISMWHHVVGYVADILCILENRYLANVLNSEEFTKLMVKCISTTVENVDSETALEQIRLLVNHPKLAKFNI